MPIGQNRLYCYADLAPLATEDPNHRDLDRFRALFEDFAEPVPSVLRELRGFDSIAWDPTAKVTFDRALLNELTTLRFLEAHAHVTIVGEKF